MKKYIVASLILCLPHLCLAGDWYFVGSGKDKSEVNTEILEVKLWAFLAADFKRQFRPKENYKFQYKFVNRNEIYINALCSSKSERADDFRLSPEFTLEQLRSNFITISDGGSCYFSVKFNPEKGTFSDLWVNGDA